MYTKSETSKSNTNHTTAVTKTFYYWKQLVYDRNMENDHSVTSDRDCGIRYRRRSGSRLVSRTSRSKLKQCCSMDGSSSSRTRSSTIADGRTCCWCYGFDLWHYFVTVWMNFDTEIFGHYSQSRELRCFCWPWSADRFVYSLVFSIFNFWFYFHPAPMFPSYLRVCPKVSVFKGLIQKLVLNCC